LHFQFPPTKNLRAADGCVEWNDLTAVLAAAAEEERARTADDENMMLF